MSKSNGFKPGSLDWIEAQYEHHSAKAEMYKGVLEDAGVVLKERKQHHASAMFTGALKAEASRKGRAWKPKEEREQENTRRQEIVRTFLQTNGDGDIYDVAKALTDAGIEVGRDRVRQIMATMPDIERVGSTYQSRYRLRAAKPAPDVRVRGTTAYVRATPESVEQRKEAIRAFVAKHPLSSIGEIVKMLRAESDKTSQSQISKTISNIREIERVGERHLSRYRIRAKKPGPATRAKLRATKAGRVVQQRGGVRHEKSRSFDGTTLEKARIVATILQEHGGMMATKDLTNAARERGISGLTGMVNYLNAGWLRRTRTPKGDSAYRFLKMPPGAETPATVESTE